MQIFLKIVAILFFISPMITVCSDQPNQLRRLPSYDGIQEGGFFEGCSDVNSKILHQGNRTLDNYGKKGDHNRTIKEIKLSSRQQHNYYNWSLYARILTDYLYRDITNDDHRRAALLYCILKKNPDAQKHNNITEYELHLLSSCAAWGAVDAIQNYRNKKRKIETNQLSWLDHEFWLLPSVEILKEKVHLEIAKIPTEMMHVYMIQCPQTGGHSVGDFLREEGIGISDSTETALQEAQESAENDRIEEEYDIIYSREDLIAAITAWNKDLHDTKNMKTLQKVCKNFSSNSSLMDCIQEYSPRNLSDRQLSALLVVTDLLDGVKACSKYSDLKARYDSSLVLDIIDVKNKKQ